MPLIGENGITPKRVLSKRGTIFCEVLKGMANQEQLRTLKKEGVEVWNKWRKVHPDENIELEGADLDTAYFSKHISLIL